MNPLKIVPNRPIEQGEERHAPVDMRALSRLHVLRESPITASVTRSFIRVTAQRPGPIGVWIGRRTVTPVPRPPQAMGHVLAQRFDLALGVTASKSGSRRRERA